jgi:flagellar hook assembly protein FlgD
MRKVALVVMAARLEQNRPKPFGGSTQFAFDLPAAGPATLAVIDVSGRVVRTLATGPGAEGRHQYRWDGGDDQGRAVAPGVYFYRLTTAAGSTTRRMVMLQ